MIRLSALILTVLTGFTGLVYEVAWQRYLATLLGSQGEATAAVLAIFLGGLSLGYAVFGRATRWLTERARRESRAPRLLLFYALVEGGIGVYAWVFPLLFTAAQAVSLLGPLEHDALGFAFDVLLSALLIGPPAVLMGGTIPILTLALAGDLEHATRVHAWIYGANTLGAFAGALAGGFFLVPWLGLDGVAFAMGCVNLLAAACFFLLDRRAAGLAPETTEAGATGPVPYFAAWAAVALLAGFAMMAIQTSLNRLGALALGSSQFTFAMVVAVFVLCIAIGSLVVSAFPRISGTPVVVCAWLLIALLVPLYLVLGDIAYWSHVIRVLFSTVAPAFYAHQFMIFVAMFVVLVLPVGLSGALLPLLFHELRREVSDLGAVAGRLYAWNTVGSLLGALLGGYLLLFWLDLHHVFRIAVATLVAGAAILTFLVFKSRARWLSLLLALPTLLTLFLLPAWSSDRLSVGVYRTRAATPESFLGPDQFLLTRVRGKVLFYDDDPTTTVTVRSGPRMEADRSIHVNGKSDGALIGDYPTMALSALIPALMADEYQRGFVIGLGTGVSAGVLGGLEGTREVTVAEISRGVIAAAPLFDSGNQAVSKNPKIEIVRGDAYRTLMRSQGRYDVIISEPSNPWVTGIEMLYSREFLEAARSRLAPGGVFGQWFHVYDSSDDVVELVLRTYAAVFPEVAVWYTGGVDLLLLGFDRNERALDVGALAERFEQPDFAAAFGRVGITSLPQLFAHEVLPLGTLNAVELEGPIHSLRHPILSNLGARSFFEGAVGGVPTLASDAHRDVSARNSLLRRYVQGADRYPEELLEVVTSETCRFRRRECLTFFAKWAHDHPTSPRFQSAVGTQREKLGIEQGAISPSRIAAASTFFDEGYSSPELNFDAAQRLMELFMFTYSHAAAYEQDVPGVIRKRCRGVMCGTIRRSASKSRQTTGDR